MAHCCTKSTYDWKMHIKMTPPKMNVFGRAPACGTTEGLRAESGGGVRQTAHIDISASAAAAAAAALGSGKFEDTNGCHASRLIER